MPTLPDAHIAGLAESCVNNMGDIFWDYDEGRDRKLDFTEPQSVAIAAVAATLRDFAQSVELNSRPTNALRLEYREILSRARGNASDEALLAALVGDGHLKEQTARELLQLAKKYGPRTLRNALALAEALGIEDDVAEL